MPPASVLRRREEVAGAGELVAHFDRRVSIWVERWDQKSLRKAHGAGVGVEE